MNRLERNRAVRLGGGIGYVDRLVGIWSIFFFLGDFWLPSAEGCLQDSRTHVLSVVSLIMFFLEGTDWLICALQFFPLSAAKRRKCFPAKKYRQRDPMRPRRSGK